MSWVSDGFYHNILPGISDGGERQLIDRYSVTALYRYVAIKTVFTKI